MVLIANRSYKGNTPDSLISTARAMTENNRFVALYGQEFSTISSGKHMNVFDVGEVIDVQKGRFDLLIDFLSANKDSGGKSAVVMLNHPKNSFSVSSKDYGFDDFGSDTNS